MRRAEDDETPPLEEMREFADSPDLVDDADRFEDELRAEFFDDEDEPGTGGYG